MRRVLSTTALAGALAVVLPMPSASAQQSEPCELASRRELGASRDQVVAGTWIDVSGRARSDELCDRRVPLRPGEPSPWTPPPVPPTALPTLPPLPTPLRISAAVPAPVAAPPASAAATHDPAPTPAPQPAVTGPVRITLGGPLPGDIYPAGTLLAEVVPDERPAGDGVTRYTFATRVRIPEGTRPGRYGVVALQGYRLFYGARLIEVVDPLAATGAPVAGLVRLGLLSLLTGGGALVAGHRAARNG